MAIETMMEVTIPMIQDISATGVMLPKIDVAFKMLFGDERNIGILRSFLESVLDLDPEEYTGITLVDPHLKAEAPDDKLSVVDVNLTTKMGQTVHIEMQIADKKNMRSRMTYLNAKLLATQLNKKEGYENLKRVISIVIADFDLIPEIQDGYHHKFELLNKRTGVRFSDLVEINALDLPKIPLNKDTTDASYDWCYFLKAERKEEFEMVAERNAAVKEAYVTLKQLSEDENNRLIYEARLTRARDEKAERELAIERAVEQAVGQAVEERSITIARKMLLKGEGIDKIVLYTELSPEEIEKLK